MRLRPAINRLSADSGSERSVSVTIFAFLSVGVGEILRSEAIDCVTYCRSLSLRPPPRREMLLELKSLLSLRREVLDTEGTSRNAARCLARHARHTKPDGRSNEGFIVNRAAWPLLLEMVARYSGSMQPQAHPSFSQA